MKITVCIMLFILSFSTHAQESLSFRGVPLGSSQQALKERFPKAQCVGRRCQTFDWDKIGDIPYKGALWEFGDAGLDFVFLTVDSSAFAVLASAIRERYGAPTDITTQAIRTRSGVELVNESLTWMLPAGRISFTRYSSSITSSILTYTSPPGIERQARDAHDAKRRAASDL